MSAPHLEFSLWSIRQWILTSPKIALDAVYSAGFRHVDLDGFAKLNPKSYVKLVRDAQLEPTCLHGPLLAPWRKPEDIASWAIRVYGQTKINRLVLESDPQQFEPSYDTLELALSERSARYSKMVEQLHQVAELLAYQGIAVWYHPYDHDYDLNPETGKPWLDAMFEFHGSAQDKVFPDGFGLQLDTYWMYRSRITPAYVEEHRDWVRSIHLNERNQMGMSVPFGSSRAKVFDYAVALRQVAEQIYWIVENDSSKKASAHLGRTYVSDMKVNKACLMAWEDFWAKVETGNLPGEQPEAEEANGPLDFPEEDIAEAPLMGLSGCFREEMGRVNTEFLFGNEVSLDYLDVSDDRVSFYVSERTRRAGHLAPEEELYEAYWPDAQADGVGNQLLKVVGGAGSGKSTFLRYFFQYYLPNYYVLGENEGQRQSPMSRGYRQSLERHLVLYADLRTPPLPIENSLYDKLWMSLDRTLKARGMGHHLRARDDKKSAILETLEVLHKAGMREKEGKPYYISWFLDNTDQLAEEGMRSLLGIISEFLPQEPSLRPPPFDGNRSNRLGLLWRVILPLRPGTSTNVNQPQALGQIGGAPWQNHQTIHLEELDKDRLVEARGEMLNQNIRKSQREVSLDYTKPGIDRAYNERRSPEEMGPQCKKYYIHGHSFGNEENAEKAREVLDNLVGGSARRRIALMARAALSRSYTSRYDEGERKGWPNRVVPYFFFDGLIRGDAAEFSSDDDDGLILNLFTLGGLEEGSWARLAGVFISDLLLKSEEWDGIQKKLSSVGCPETVLLAATRKLSGVDFIKKLWNSSWFVDRPILKGHLGLLEQSAYIDCMAVTCSRAWKQSFAKNTDALDATGVWDRVEGSIHLIGLLAKAEWEVSVFRPIQGIQFHEWKDRFNSLRLDSCALRMAEAYKRSIVGLQGFPRLNSLINAQADRWQTLLDRLNFLITKLRNDSVLSAKNQGTRNPYL